jgi:hypothetical protein
MHAVTVPALKTSDNHTQTLEWTCLQRYLLEAPEIQDPGQRQCHHAQHPKPRQPMEICPLNVPQQATMHGPDLQGMLVLSVARVGHYDQGLACSSTWMQYLSAGIIHGALAMHAGTSCNTCRPIIHSWNASKLRSGVTWGDMLQPRLAVLDEMALDGKDLHCCHDVPGHPIQEQLLQPTRHGSCLCA